MMSLEHCRGIVSLDEDSVTVLGGTQIGEVFNYLLDNGRNVACSPGVITYQTIGESIVGQKSLSFRDCFLPYLEMCLDFISVS